MTVKYNSVKMIHVNLKRASSLLRVNYNSVKMINVNTERSFSDGKL